MSIINSIPVEVDELPSIVIGESFLTLSLDERVEAVTRQVNTLAKRSFDSNLYGNPYRFNNEPPEEVLRYGMYKYYEEEMSKLRNA